MHTLPLENVATFTYFFFFFGKMYLIITRLWISQIAIVSTYFRTRNFILSVFVTICGNIKFVQATFSLYGMNSKIYYSHVFKYFFDVRGPMIPWKGSKRSNCQLVVLSFHKSCKGVRVRTIANAYIYFLLLFNLYFTICPAVHLVNFSNRYCNC